jgi:hypothetical protein
MSPSKIQNLCQATQKQSQMMPFLGETRSSELTYLYHLHPKQMEVKRLYQRQPRQSSSGYFPQLHRGLRGRSVWFSISMRPWSTAVLRHVILPLL